MTVTQLQASLRLWKAREGYRKRLHTRAHLALVQARVNGGATQALIDRRDLRSRQLAEARAMIARREQQLAAKRGPRIYTGAQAGFARPTRSFGMLGPLRAVTCHHAAGPRADSSHRAIELNRLYDTDHRAKNWGAIGYHETIDDLGNLYVTPRALAGLTGAHTGLENTGNYGLLVHGNYETMTPTPSALATLRWRIEHGHERGLPDLRGLPVKGHKDWPQHRSNLCPGAHLYPRLKELG